MAGNVGKLELQCNAIVVEGFESIEDLGEMLLKDVSNVCATLSKLAANRGGVRIGYALVRKLKGSFGGSKTTIAAARMPTKAIGPYKFVKTSPITWTWRTLERTTVPRLSLLRNSKTAIGFNRS